MALLNQEQMLNHAKFLIGQAPNFFLESHCPDYPKIEIALCGAWGGEITWPTFQRFGSSNKDVLYTHNITSLLRKHEDRE